VSTYLMRRCSEQAVPVVEWRIGGSPANNVIGHISLGANDRKPCSLRLALWTERSVDDRLCRRNVIKAVQAKVMMNKRRVVQVLNNQGDQVLPTLKFADMIKSGEDMEFF
jgi:hypothetical protein